MCVIIIYGSGEKSTECTPRANEFGHFPHTYVPTDFD